MGQRPYLAARDKVTHLKLRLLINVESTKSNVFCAWVSDKIYISCLSKRMFHKLTSTEDPRRKHAVAVKKTHRKQLVTATEFTTNVGWSARQDKRHKYPLAVFTADDVKAKPRGASLQQHLPRSPTTRPRLWCKTWTPHGTAITTMDQFHNLYVWWQRRYSVYNSYRRHVGGIRCCSNVTYENICMQESCRLRIMYKSRYIFWITISIGFSDFCI